MARKTAADTELTRQAILESALVVFARDGYGAASLEAIARHARLTRGAIYWHYPGKAPLLAALLAASEFPLESFLDQPIALDKGLARLRKAMLQTLLDKRCQQLHQLLLQKSEWIEPVVARLHLIQQRFRAQVSLLLQEARACGTVSAQVDTEHAARWLQANVTGLIFDSLQRPQAARGVDITLKLFRQWLVHPG